MSFHLWSHLPDTLQLYIHTYCDITTTIQLAQTSTHHKHLLEPHLPKYLHCAACNTQLCHAAHIDHTATNSLGAICIRLNRPAVGSSGSEAGLDDIIRCGTCKLYIGQTVDTQLLQLNTHLASITSQSASTASAAAQQQQQHETSTSAVTSCITFIRRKLFSSNNNKTVKRKLLFDDMDVTQKLQRLQSLTTTSDATTIYTLSMQYIVVRNGLMTAVQSCRQSCQPVLCRYCHHILARGSDILSDDSHMMKYITKHGLLVNTVSQAALLHAADRTSVNIAGGILQYSTVDVFCADCKHYVGVQICPDTTCDRLIHMQGRYILHTNCIEYTAETEACDTSSVISITVPIVADETSEQWSRSDSMACEEPSMISNMDVECSQIGHKMAEKCEMTDIDSEDQQMSEVMLNKFLSDV